VNHSVLQVHGHRGLRGQASRCALEQKSGGGEGWRGGGAEKWEWVWGRRELVGGSWYEGVGMRELE